MRNFIQTGETLDLAAPYAVAAGEGALVGTAFGVAQNTLANGVVGPFDVEGVFDLKCVTTDVPAAGAAIYWDNAAKQCTTTSAGNTKIGVATVTKISGPAVVRVRLNGAF